MLALWLLDKKNYLDGSPCSKLLNTAHLRMKGRFKTQQVCDVVQNINLTLEFLTLLDPFLVHVMLSAQIEPCRSFQLVPDWSNVSEFVV